MNNLIILQLSLEELREMLQEEFEAFLSKMPPASSSSPAPAKELLSVKEASSYLNLACSTIYNLVYRKAIPCIKGPRKLYFSTEELRKWVEEGRKPTQAALQAAAQAYLNQLKKR